MKIFICIFLLIHQLERAIAQANPIQKRVNEYLSQVYAHHAMPGFSVVVLKESKTIFSKGFGVEVLGQQKPFTPNSVVGIGSVTKSLTALAIMQLVEQQKIDLDKPIVFYLPWFRTANKERSDKITVGMLLNHTSGIFGNATNSNDMTDKSTEGLARALQSVYLTREPGISYEYSNLGYCIAGLIVNKVSGMPYTRYVEEKIFRPLDMSRTTTDHELFDKLQTIYGHYPGIKNGIPAKRIIELESGEYIPAGLLTKSCASDLGKYMMMMMHGGIYHGHQIISEKSIQAVWTASISFPGLKKEQGGEGKNSHYGLGWEISNIDGRDIIYHGGSTGTSSAVVVFDLKKQIAAAIVINIDLTLIDEYRYQTLLNIVNNILHLAAEEPVTDYGIYRIKDPSRNNYELDKSFASKYTGEYISLAGGLWMFDGADMNIRENSNGELEASIYRGKQVIYQFDLDFVNRSSAVSRNIFIPGQVRFKIAPDGSVSSLFFNGTEYIKQNDFLQVKYRMVKSADGYIQFKLSVDWRIEWVGSYFKAYSTCQRDLMLEGCITDVDSVAGPEFISNRLKKYAIRFSGIPQSENAGRLVWKEKSMISEKDGGVWQHIVLSAKSGNHACYLLLTTPQTAFTSELQKLVSPLITTFRFNE